MEFQGLIIGQIELRGNLVTRKVWLNGMPLDPAKSQSYRRHTSDGFAWGYSGSGPAQLALAICMELVPWSMANLVYQKFKEQHIAPLPETDFDVMIDVRFDIDFANVPKV